MEGSRDTPVVLFVFNRPNPTARVWAAIRHWQPARLFVVADGPRRRYPDDAEQCRRVRDCVATVDWPCQVTRFYAEGNLGCRQRINSGLDAVFTVVDQAIILEDDCLVADDFFRFCSSLLARYRDDTSIHAICASNYLPAPEGQGGTYSATRYPCSWGWATWRRAWAQADPTLTFWPQWRDSSDWLQCFPERLERWYWTLLLDDCLAGRIDTWDIPWWANIWHQRGYVLMAHRTLVSNIGFGADGTHTIDRHHPLADRPLQPLGQLIHPVHLALDPGREQQAFAIGMDGAKLRWPFGVYTLPRLWLGQRYRMLRQSWQQRLRQAVG